jgi:hypothetical protein
VAGSRSPARPGSFFHRRAPALNTDGFATYTFTAATIAAGGNQIPVPTGTITSADVLIDVQGTADLKDITLNGVKQVPVVGNAKQCKKGGWKTFTQPTFVPGPFSSLHRAQTW